MIQLVFPNAPRCRHFETSRTVLKTVGPPKPEKPATHPIYTLKRPITRDRSPPFSTVTLTNHFALQNMPGKTQRCVFGKRCLMLNCVLDLSPARWSAFACVVVNKAPYKEERTSATRRAKRAVHERRPGGVLMRRGRWSETAHFRESKNSTKLTLSVTHLSVVFGFTCCKMQGLHGVKKLQVWSLQIIGGTHLF